VTTHVSRAVVWVLATAFGVVTAAPADACWLKCGQQRRASYQVGWPPKCEDPNETYLCCNKDSNELEAPGDNVNPANCACVKGSIGDKCARLCWDPALQGWRPALPGDNPAFIRIVTFKNAQPVPLGAGK